MVYIVCDAHRLGVPVGPHRRPARTETSRTIAMTFEILHLTTQIQRWLNKRIAQHLAPAKLNALSPLTAEIASHISGKADASRWCADERECGFDPGTHSGGHRRRAAPLGLAKATVVDVARALDVSHGSVYRHFPSKASLREAVAQRWLDRVNAPLAKDRRKLRARRPPGWSAGFARCSRSSTRRSRRPRDVCDLSDAGAGGLQGR